MRYPSQPVFLFADAPGGAVAPTSPVADSPAESTPAEGAHDNLAGMEDNDFDLVEVPLEETPTGGEPGATPEQPPAPAAPQPAAQPAQPVPPQQVAPQAPAAQNVPSAPRSPLDTAIEGFRTNHKQLSDWASQNLFALSKEDAEGLETDAAAMIPILMGRVYSQALQATTNLIKNFVPNMINDGVSTTTARQAKATEALQQFYAANPGLNPQQHGALVDKWARAFRAANPNASRADAIAFVGRAVSTEVGQQAQNGATRRVQPFAPARPGTRVQTPAQKHDPYEGMDMEFDQE